MSDRKVCVVTGSSSGIGAATARLYAERGWNVAINYSREAAPAERVADECRALGAAAIAVKADVADDAACVRLAARVEAEWGRADVLVNNAGTTRFVAPTDLDALSAPLELRRGGGLWPPDPGSGPQSAGATPFGSASPCAPAASLVSLRHGGHHQPGDRRHLHPEVRQQRARPHHRQQRRRDHHHHQCGCVRCGFGDAYPQPR